MPCDALLQTRADNLPLSWLQTDLGLYAFWAVYILGGGAFVASKLRK